jgi:hypothetical protein
VEDIYSIMQDETKRVALKLLFSFLLGIYSIKMAHINHLMLAPRQALLGRYANSMSTYFGRTEWIALFLTLDFIFFLKERMSEHSYSSHSISFLFNDGLFNFERTSAE